MLYNVESPAKKALDGLSMASNTYGKMGQNIPANQDPGPSAGGAISAGMGGAVVGAQIGTYVAAGSTAGPVGAVAGAAVGIAAYLLS
ncbi:MAG: hypothetical protein PF440_04695 [Thiomicrorhabdus sp.]|jgi:hypothetical protein|nr:hypothetical protein [Thiomicrorhabdus sp.]